MLTKRTGLHTCKTFVFSNERDRVSGQYPSCYPIDAFNRPWMCSIYADGRGCPSGSREPGGYPRPPRGGGTGNIPTPHRPHGDPDERPGDSVPRDPRGAPPSFGGGMARVPGGDVRAPLNQADMRWYYAQYAIRSAIPTGYYPGGIAPGMVRTQPPWTPFRPQQGPGFFGPKMLPEGCGVGEPGAVGEAGAGEVAAAAGITLVAVAANLALLGGLVYLGYWVGQNKCKDE